MGEVGTVGPLGTPLGYGRAAGGGGSLLPRNGADVNFDVLFHPSRAALPPSQLNEETHSRDPGICVMHGWVDACGWGVSSPGVPTVVGEW